MTYARLGDTVKVHYTGRFDDGSVFDTSANDAPLEFQIGEGRIITGFEMAVIGMYPGETKIVRIPAAEAYGQPLPSLIHEVSRDAISPPVEPQPGKHIRVHDREGQMHEGTVVAVSDADVTVDANHPLAGRDLIFEIQLLELV